MATEPQGKTLRNSRLTPHVVRLAHHVLSLSKDASRLLRIGVMHVSR